MLKPYYNRVDLDGNKPAAMVVPVEPECVEELESGNKDKEAVRLKNSDVLNDLRRSKTETPL